MRYNQHQQKFPTLEKEQKGPKHSKEKSECTEEIQVQFYSVFTIQNRRVQKETRPERATCRHIQARIEGMGIFGRRGTPTMEPGFDQG